MAKKECVCAVCKERFDRNSIQSVQYGPRRYAHYTCAPDKPLVPMEKSPSSDPDRQALMDYIKKIYGTKANYPIINKQIKTFIDNGYTYSGILKSLVYFYEVKHNSVDKSNGGIGIVEYCYNAARDYYYAIWLAQQANEDKSFVTRVKEYIIKPPQKKGVKPRLLDWEIDDEE